MGRPWRHPGRTVSSVPLRGPSLKKLDRAQDLLRRRLRARPSQAVTVEYALDALLKELEGGS